MPLQETVTLINRTTETLKATFDGMDIPIKPGKNYGFPAVVVPYAKGQNPVRGSRHPYSPTSFQSLVAVDGTKDDASPIDVLSDATVELFDRSKMGGIASQAVAIPGSPTTAWDAREGMKEIDGDALAAER
jgi:hypothetical protein